MASIDKVTTAHGITGSLAWVIFLPLGAIVKALYKGPRAWLIHASIQVFGMALFTINVGQGIWLSLIQPYQYAISDYHPVIGLVLFALAWTQPISGYTGHILSKKKGGRTILSHLHMWLGRSLITLGMIQGGLGLLYAGGDASRAENIAYGVVAAVIWLTYVAIVVRSLVPSKSGKSASTKREMKSAGGQSP